MKIEIYNFGPISKFEFDTSSDFHLIVGDNNIGKSYALSIFYFIVKEFLKFEKLIKVNPYFYNIGLGDESEDETKIILNALGKKIRDNRIYDIDITDTFLQLAEVVFIRELMEGVDKQVESTYGEGGFVSNQFNPNVPSVFKIELDSLKFSIEYKIGDFRIFDLDFGTKIILRPAKQNRSPIEQSGNLILYRNTKDERIEDCYYQIISLCNEFVRQNFRVGMGGIDEIDFLPASRSGLYQALSAFGQIIAELSKSRSFLTSKIELPNIASQLSDYFIKLTSIQNSSNVDEQYEGIARQIEVEILKGRIDYDFDKKRIFYIPNDTDLRLDISNASSMISETAPIVAYIRHILSRRERKISVGLRGQLKSKTGKVTKKILIIEEPEAHLHPKNQLAITEIYSKLSKLGVKIIMTSHSNYVFNKFSNLIITEKIATENVRCDLLEMTGVGSVARKLDVDEMGVDDQNFGDVTEILINERMDFFNKKNDK